METHSSLSDGAIESILGLGPKPATEPVAATIEFSQCGSCDHPLGWPAPVAEQWAIVKACPQCGRRYFVANGDSSASTAESAELSPDEALTFNLGHSPRATIENELLARLVGHHRMSAEHRKHVRYPINRDVVCVPLDASADPAYESLDARLLDMSDTGASLRISTYWTWPMVVLDFSCLEAKGHQLLARVVWKRHEATGTRIGCEFVACLL